MNPQRFLQHMIETFGLPARLAAEEAKVLLSWLLERLESVVRHAHSEQEAWELTYSLQSHARWICRLTELSCYEEDRDAAARLWRQAEAARPFPELPRHDPVITVNRLLDDTHHLWPASGFAQVAPSARH